MSNWNILSEDQKRQFARNLVQRRIAYETWHRHGVIASTKDVLLIADQPGPGAPKDDAYHHTPFYAKTHSGGWLNALLVEAEITEDRLFWENSADRHSAPRDTKILMLREWKHVIALGGNAATWLKKNGVQNFWKFDHPQYHKRWKSKEGLYPLISNLKVILDPGSFSPA